MGADLIRIGEERRMIFSNVANGVPIEQIMRDFRRSEQEVMAEVGFVARKIAEYRFRRQIPPLDASTLKDIRWNRLALLDALTMLGPEYLASSLIIPKITVQKLDHHTVVSEAARRIGVRVG